MRRISVWVTVVLAIVVLLLAYWLNTTGQTGKEGDNGRQVAVEVNPTPGDPRRAPPRDRA